MTAISYADNGMPVDGWFSPLDARVMIAVDEMQRAAGTTGDLLEIGAYLGKSVVLLGYLTRGSERLHVVDLFEDDAPSNEIQRESERFYEGLTIDRFLANYRRFHATPPVIHQGPSHEQMPRLDKDSYRLIHVDGSHSFRAVVADTVESGRLAGTGAIIVFDDMTQRHAPGVAAAVWDAVLHRGLRPLALTKKLYATWDPEIDYHDIIGHTNGLVVGDEHDVAGHSVAELKDVPIEDTAVRRVARGLLPPAVVAAGRRVLGR